MHNLHLRLNLQANYARVQISGNILNFHPAVTTDEEEMQKEQKRTPP